MVAAAVSNNLQDFYQGGADVGYQPGSIARDLDPALTDRGFNRTWFDLRRPFEHKGQKYVVVNAGRTELVKGERKPVREARRVVDLFQAGWDVPTYILNASTMPKEVWIEMDRTIQREFRRPLKLWNDIAAIGTRGGTDWWTKMTLEYTVVSDPGEIVVDMLGVSEARDDTPLYKWRSLPIPILHGDMVYSKRELGVGRNWPGESVDMTMAEALTRRIGETLEKLALGTQTGPTYGTVSVGPTAHDGTSTVYGALNFPQRLTKTNVTNPTGGSWTPELAQVEVNASLAQLRANNIFGPWLMYYSTDWEVYMSGDYYAKATSGMTSPSITLKERLLKIDGIQSVERLDFLSPTASEASHVDGTNPFTWLFISADPMVVQAVGQGTPVAIMWETKGGLMTHQKLLSMAAPLWRSDYQGRAGILQATTT